MASTSYQISLKLETGTHTSRIHQLLVSKDGSTLITAGERTIRIWDIETRKPLRMLLGQVGAGANGQIRRIALSPDDRYVAAAAVWSSPEQHEGADQEMDLRVYELATGNLQARFHFVGAVQDLDFSPEGKHLALLASQKGRVQRRSLQVYDWSAVLRAAGTAPKPLASELLEQHPGSALEPAYVRFVPANAQQGAEAQIVVAAALRTPGQNPESSGALFWYSFSVSGGLRKLPISRETEEHLVPTGLAASRELVVVTADRKELFCYDHSGRLVERVLTGSVPAAPSFSSSGKQLIVGQRGDGALVEVCVYESSLRQLRLKSTYHGHDAEVVAAGFLRNGTAVSAGGDQNSIHFWNASHFEGELAGVIQGAGRAVHAVGIDSAEEIGIGNYDDLRSADGRIVLQRAFRLRGMAVHPLSIPDSRGFTRARTKAGKEWLQRKSQADGTVLCLQPADRAVLEVSPSEGYDLTTFGFTPGGAIVIGDSQGSLRVAARRGARQKPSLRRALIGHTAPILDHAANEKWLVTGGADQIVRLWYVPDVEQDHSQDLEPALNLFVGSDDEWVIWSKSGFYNASQRGDRRIGYQVSRGPDQEAIFFPGDRFVRTLFRPDILQAIVEYGSEERALAELAKQGHAVAPLQINQILPPIVELAENGVTATQDELRLAFKAGSLIPGQPISRVWIVQNDRFAWESRTPRTRYRVTLPLLPGRNRVKILAETGRAKSPALRLQVPGSPPRKMAARQSRPKADSSARGNASRAPRLPANTLLGDGISAIPDNGILYLLAIGVSTLQKPRPDKDFNNLHFADEDAIAIYNALTRARFSDRLEKTAPPRNRAFRSVEATLLLNERATKSAIENAVQRICARIKTRGRASASERDVLFVFLSGHGVRRTDAITHEQELYFWNYDLDFDHTRQTGLSLIRLGKAITSIPADVILATDACHAGMAGSDVARGLDPNELAQRIYAINERGLYVLNAARSEELAIESARKDFEHGVFTKSILETLQTESSVSMLELIASVQERVDYYTHHEQTPICRTYGDLLPLVIYQK